MSLIVFIIFVLKLYSLSNNSKLTPVVDEKIQPLLSKLKNRFSGAYYEAISDEETKPKDIKIFDCSLISISIPPKVLILFVSNKIGCFLFI